MPNPTRPQPRAHDPSATAPSEERVMGNTNACATGACEECYSDAMRCGCECHHHQYASIDDLHRAGLADGAAWIAEENRKAAEAAGHGTKRRSLLTVSQILAVLDTDSRKSEALCVLLEYPDVRRAIEPFVRGFLLAEAAAASEGK